YKTELAPAFLAKGSTGTVGAPPTFRQAANEAQAPPRVCQRHAGIGRIQSARVHLNIFEQPPHISNSPCWSSSPCLGEPPPRTAEQARGTERDRQTTRLHSSLSSGVLLAKKTRTVS